MSTAAVQVHINPVDDQRAVCDCGKQIRWCELKKRWFHVHNFMTFCTGQAIDASHNDQPKASPADWRAHGERIQSIKVRV